MKHRLIDWDWGYQTGRWEGASDQDELVRYSSLAWMIRMAGVNSLLDAGCGLGLLRSFLMPGTLRAYTGIDVSQVALDRVPERQTHERFICSRLEDWQTTETFDGILLNEVLYYFDDPEAVLLKMHQRLAPAGVMIVSIYQHRSWRSPNRRALKAARRFFAAHGYATIQDLQITSLIPEEKTWSILVGKSPSPLPRTKEIGSGNDTGTVK